MPSPGATAEVPYSAAGSDVVRHVRRLIQMDTSNPGSTEAAAAAYISEELEHVGIVPQLFEPTPGRCSVVARHAGLDKDLPALIVHCHLDTVPCEGEGWSHDPLGGALDEGCVWGRGALDMKNVAGMMLALELHLARCRLQPRRDVIFAYFADEEGGCHYGSKWIVENAPEVFSGAREAIGEVGGFTVRTATGHRIYPIQVGERGALWCKVTVTGRAGHAAFAEGASVAAAAASAIAAVGALELPIRRSPTLDLLLAEVRGILNLEASERDVLAALGDFGRIVALGDSATVVPTILEGGTALNVAPGSVAFYLDCRFVPGQLDQLRSALARAVGPRATIEVVGEMPGVSAPAFGPLFEAMGKAIKNVDPAGAVVPFIFPAATDGQRLAELGITCYGFTPLICDRAFEYLTLFHAPNERVPLEALERGSDALAEVVMSY